MRQLSPRVLQGVLLSAAKLNLLIPNNTRYYPNKTNRAKIKVTVPLAGSSLCLSKDDRKWIRSVATRSDVSISLSSTVCDSLPSLVFLFVTRCRKINQLVFGFQTVSSTCRSHLATPELWGWIYFSL